MTRSVKIYWTVFLWAFAALVLILVLINFGVFGKMPSLTQLENPTITLASEVYGDDGTSMGKYFKERGNRSNVPYKEISKHVINALIATEDERFYDHSGIDGKGFMRALLFLGTKGGGSTITQQLALNMFAERASNPVVRVIQKLKEWIIAVNWKEISPNRKSSLFISIQFPIVITYMVFGMPPERFSQKSQTGSTWKNQLC